MNTELEEQLRQFVGTTQYHSSTFGRLNLTDGVDYLRENANCFWFIDIIESYQHKLKKVNFQIWGIRIYDDKSAMVYCKEDSDEAPIVIQYLNYTDFPLKNFELYCIDGVVLLKSEY